MFKSTYSKKHILLVDDDRYLNDVLSMMLETHGYYVDRAFSAQQALDHASSSVDLILLDRSLPDLNAFEVCRKLKLNQATEKIPIIILSDRDNPEDAITSLHLGADDYLPKPYECDELIARMEAVMRRSQVLPQKISDYRVQEKVIGELRKVIEEERIIPYFQPIFYLKPFRLLGLEILSRPQSNLLGNPELLFKVAIQFGFYTELEILCWRKALEYLIKHHAVEEKLFFNCNPYLIEGPQHYSIKYLFSQNKINTKNVVLEITERSVISNFKRFYEYLSRYRDYGFQFAIDDVGGGYSSLESIVETKPEVVKIDPHIVHDLHHDMYKCSIIKFIVAFCRENNIISIAEGVETEEDMRIITHLGVDAGQGYYLSQPHQNIDFKQLQQLNQKFS